MGSPKALVELAGRPLISHAVAAVEAAGLQPIVTAKPSSPLPPLDCPIVREPEEPRHPLSGVLAALRALEGRPIIAVGCDMPFLTGPLLAWLASLDAPLAVCEAGGELHPLLARYDPSLIEDLDAALARGDAMRAAVTALGPRIVGEPELSRFGDPERLCFNVNQPADLVDAQRMAERAS
jgi:molybdopterin-guanine dinucleotide biosynthesis protein A